MREAREWTLTAAARALGEPQHRLIYLCEKGVVQPDLEDAKGRGSSRRFSARNVLEFAVALRLRELELPASVIGAVTHTLRAFERGVRRRIGDFCLPESLRGPAAPDLRTIITDGRLYVTIGLGQAPPAVYGGIALKSVTTTKKPIGELRQTSTSKRSARPNGDAFGELREHTHARVEISITRIAQELPLTA